MVNSEEGVSGTLITDTSAEYHHMSMYGIKQMGRDPDTGASAEYEILGKGGSSPRISDIYSSNRAFAAKTKKMVLYHGVTQISVV